MTIKTKKLDSANFEVSASISSEIINKHLDMIAKEASKTMDVAGFRKGKIPLNVVKQRYGDKLKQDAQNEAFRDLFNQSLEKLKISNTDLTGEPKISKFDESDKGIDAQMIISIKPTIDIKDYKTLVPDIKQIKVTQKELDERLKQIAGQTAPLEKIKRKRAVKDDDFALIDFEGFLDGKPFDGGKAEKYPLHIGSNSFIVGFEEQVIGMKYDEQKEIKVTFPKDYKADNLAGKEVVFKVKLNEIQEKVMPEFDDEFAKKVLVGEKDGTIKKLNEQIKTQIKNEKKAKYYNEELKQAYFEALTKNIEFDVPQNILHQEIDVMINNKARTMDEKEIKELQDDIKKIEKLKKELEPDAKNNVKLTFIVDALASELKIQVSDDEVKQILSYEAMQSGQNPQELVEHYTKNGYLPAIKMSILEERVITNIFDNHKGK